MPGVVGGATVQQVCDALGGESHQNVSKHLRTLYAAGWSTADVRGTASATSWPTGPRCGSWNKMVASVDAQLEDAGDG